VTRRQRRQQRQRRRSGRALGAVAAAGVLGAVGALAGMAAASDQPQRSQALRRAPVAIEPSLATASAAVQARADAQERLSLAMLANAAERQAAEKSSRDSIWDRIAACETQGNWSMRGPSFSGGVGFSNAAWSSWGGSEFAPNAGQATREQQIVVAERIRSGVGLGAWGCAKKLGLTGQ
jgi:transglycosylase-like protein